MKSLKLISPFTKTHQELPIVKTMSILKQLDLAEDHQIKDLLKALTIKFVLISTRLLAKQNVKQILCVLLINIIIIADSGLVLLLEMVKLVKYAMSREMHKKL